MCQLPKACNYRFVSPCPNLYPLLIPTCGGGSWVFQFGVVLGIQGSLTMSASNSLSSCPHLPITDMCCYSQFGNPSLRTSSLPLGSYRLHWSPEVFLEAGVEPHDLSSHQTNCHEWYSHTRRYRRLNSLRRAVLCLTTLLILLHPLSGLKLPPPWEADNSSRSLGWLLIALGHLPLLSAFGTTQLPHTRTE